MTTDPIVQALDAAYDAGLIGPWSRSAVADSRGRRRGRFTIALASGDSLDLSPAQAWAFVQGAHESFRRREARVQRDALRQLGEAMNG